MAEPIRGMLSLSLIFLCRVFHRNLACDQAEPPIGRLSGGQHVQNGVGATDCRVSWEVGARLRTANGPPRVSGARCSHRTPSCCRRRSSPRTQREAGQRGTPRRHHNRGEETKMKAKIGEIGPDGNAILAVNMAPSSVLSLGLLLTYSP